MIFALLAATMITAIVVFGSITENAAKEEPKTPQEPEVGDESMEFSNDRDKDKNREKVAQKKIAKANSPKNQVKKNSVQQIAPIPVKNKQNVRHPQKTPVNLSSNTPKITKSHSSVSSRSR